MNTTQPKGATTSVRVQQLATIQADNERLAAQVISVALVNTGHDRPIPTGIARIIAAAVHDGPQTALGSFAATGHLNRAQAAAELRDVHCYHTPAYWQLALEHFINVRRRP